MKNAKTREEFLSTFNYWVKKCAQDMEGNGYNPNTIMAGMLEELSIAEIDLVTNVALAMLANEGIQVEYVIHEDDKDWVEIKPPPGLEDGGAEKTITKDTGDGGFEVVKMSPAPYDPAKADNARASWDKPDTADRERDLDELGEYPTLTSVTAGSVQLNFTHLESVLLEQASEDTFLDYKQAIIESNFAEQRRILNSFAGPGDVPDTARSGDIGKSQT